MSLPSPDAAGWVAETLAALTLDEKVSLVSGRDAWSTRPIERLKVPSLKVTDGPNGARGDGLSGQRAASFPVGTALGATWNADLLVEVGEALAAEARTKGARVLLGPTVNLHRSPLGGRNFECFSEDPLLTARLATAYIDGLQSAGVGACLKHYVANDSEFERMTISSEVDERTLRELYLLPFERAVVEARPWSIMGAYNRINGTYACDHHRLLVEVLKDEWGFDGLVVSDWGALHSTVDAANGGCDLEMPGPGAWFGAALLDAVKAGSVDESVLDDKVRRVLRTIERTDLRAELAAGHRIEPEPERAVDQPHHRALIRRAAAEAMVLLENRRIDQIGPRVLPLVPGEGLRTIAVIGPNAVTGTFQGGGSSVVRPHEVIHPLAGITARAAAEGIEVLYEPGCGNDRFVPEPDPSWFMPLDDSGRVWRITYVDGDDPGGDAVSGRAVRTVSHWWWLPPAGVADPDRWSARWTARFVAPASGPFTFSLAATGRSRVLLDGSVVVDNWSAPEPDDVFFGRGTAEVRGRIELIEGSVHELWVELARDEVPGVAAIRFGGAPEPPRGEIGRAVELARETDAAVVIVGTNGDWESEGADRVSMRLPGRQDDLVRRVAEVNPRTIVVLNTGSPVELPWAPIAPAVLQMWFPGQELGNALADVLFGDVDPGGRLPTTFPLRYEDHPAYFNYPGERDVVRYGEGVFVGYRAYETKGQPVRYRFGHGLSYTTFDYGEVTVTEMGSLHPATDAFGPDAALRPPTIFRVAIPVTNSGDRTGHEVTQLYVRPPVGGIRRPDRELKGFAKSTLEPGESTVVSIDLDVRSFAAFDVSVPGWRAEAGDYQLLIGGGGELEARATVTLPVELVLPIG